MRSTSSEIPISLFLLNFSRVAMCIKPGLVLTLKFHFLLPLFLALHFVNFLFEKSNNLFTPAGWKTTSIRENSAMLLVWKECKKLATSDCANPGVEI